MTRVNKRGTLFPGSRDKSWASIKEKLFEGYIDIKGDSSEDCWEIVPRGFISGLTHFGPKQCHEWYIQSGQHFKEAQWTYIQSGQHFKEAQWTYIQSGQHFKEARWTYIQSGQHFKEVRWRSFKVDNILKSPKQCQKTYIQSRQYYIRMKKKILMNLQSQVGEL